MADDNKGGPMESLKIPLNLKNAYRPFVLDPNNEMMKVNENAAAVGGKPQVFSFKKDPSLGILPNSWNVSSALKSDISMGLIYGMNSTGKMIAGGPISLKDHLLQHIPMVQIREYQQDSKLNQVFSLFGSLKEGFDKGSEAASSGSSVGDALAGLKTTAEKWWKTFKWIVVNPDIFVKKLLGGMELSRKMTITESDDKSYLSIVKVPHILYYQMISSLSLNIFELPFSGEFVREASGHGGWNTGRGIKGIGGGGNGIFSKFISYFGDNIKVSMTPTWDGAADEEGTTIEFTVNLFNDSVDAACVNFVFVNTLLPGMMFTQYHIFQQSPSLFDIKVDGLGRYFMCSGSVKVEYKGVLRTPSPTVIKNLATKYANPIYKFDENYLRKSGLVKIPDSYQVTLQFKSLLPNSFNNYIYSNCANNEIKKEDKTYTPSMYDDLIKSFKTTIEEIGSKLEKGEEPFQPSQAEMDQANAEEAMEAHNEEVERMNNGEGGPSNYDDYPPGMGPNDYEEG